MNKKLKPILIIAITIGVIFLLFRITFIRTVNYEIAGVKIPSKYNILTGSISPIANYKGTTDLPSVSPTQKNNIGLSKDDIAKAEFRWALFSQWASTRSEYKGWENDPEIFKKARAAFKEDMKKFKGVTVIR